MFETITGEANIASVIKKHARRRGRTARQEDGVGPLPALLTAVRERLLGGPAGSFTRTVVSGIEIIVPPIEERLAQLAVINVLTSRVDWWRVPGVSVVFGERALRHHLELLVTKHGPYICYADIKSYFRSINHDRCQSFLESRIADTRVVGLVTVGLGLTVGGVGIAVGNPLSTFIGDRFLTVVDEGLRGLRAVRFHDDYLIGARTPATADGVVEQFRSACKPAALQLNEEKLRVKFKPVSYNSVIHD